LDDFVLLVVEVGVTPAESEFCTDAAAKIMEVERQAVRAV
jgi:hypothetical protein